MANNGISINGDTRKQNVHQAYPSHGPVEIVELPSYQMVDLSSSLCRRLPGRVASLTLPQIHQSQPQLFRWTVDMLQEIPIFHPVKAKPSVFPKAADS